MIQDAKKHKDMTTGQLARLAGVVPRTASKWADMGLLKHYRIPGSSDRRYRPEDVAEFFAAHGIEREVPGVEPGRPRRKPARPAPPRVLYVGFTPAMRGELSRDGAVASFCQPGPSAGLAMADFAPAVVVVDSAIGRIESAQHAAAARSVEALAVVYGGDSLPRGEFHAWAATPGDLDAVLARLAEKTEGGAA